MKIGFDAKRLYHNTTGLGNYSRDLVRILAEYYPNHQFILYNPKLTDRNLFKSLSDTILQVLPDTFLGKKFPFLWRSFWVKNRILKDQLDIFHGLSGELPFGLMGKKVKTVVTIHDLIFIRYPKLYHRIDRILYTFKYRKACQNADIVVAISEQTKQDIISFFKINPDKIKVIYQGCSDVFKKSQSVEFQQEVLKKYNIPKNYIFYVGSLIERKNALSALKAIHQTGDYLVILGDGKSYRKKLENYVTENHLQDRVLFLKGLTLEEIAVLYKNAQIFIYPSSFEGFGIPIIEAMFSRTPVITGKGSCFPEAGGKDSIYIDPQNIDEIVQAIQWIKQDNSKRKAMIDNGLEYVQRFNDSNIAQNWINLYQSLLK